MFSVATQDIRRAHKQLNSMQLAWWSIDQYPAGHGPVLFARMVTGNEKISNPDLKHEEISNSQVTTGKGIPQYGTALPSMSHRPKGSLGLFLYFVISNSLTMI